MQQGAASERLERASDRLGIWKCLSFAYAPEANCSKPGCALFAELSPDLRGSAFGIAVGLPLPQRVRHHPTPLSIGRALPIAGKNSHDRTFLSLTGRIKPPVQPKFQNKIKMSKTPITDVSSCRSGVASGDTLRDYGQMLPRLRTSHALGCGAGRGTSPPAAMPTDSRAG